MKKIIALLMSICLTVSLCACASNDDNVRGEITTGASNEAAETEELSLGEVDGSVYENDFIGIGYKLDDGWSFYSDEQIKELNNITTDAAGEEYEELVKNADIVYDMYAADSDGLNNVNINLEKVNALQLKALDIAENFENSAPTIKASYENMGYTNFDYEISTVEVDGKELDAMYITAETNGYGIYQCAFAKKCSGYLANITVTAYIEDTTSQLVDNFYWTE